MIEKYKTIYNNDFWDKKILVPNSTIDYSNKISRWEENLTAIAELTAYAAKLDEENKAIYIEYHNTWKSFRDAFKIMEDQFVLGSMIKSSKKAKMLNELAPIAPYSLTHLVKDMVATYLRDKKYEDEKKLAETREKEKKTAKENKIVQAVLFLVGRGYKQVSPGIWQMEGNTPIESDAISFANEIRRNELIAEATSGDQMHSFGGDDNCEGCDGWNGEDYRCSCGNRRVEWISEGDFEDMYIFGRAY